MNKLLVISLFLLSFNSNANQFLANYDIEKEEITVNQKIESIDIEPENYDNVNTQSNHKLEKDNDNDNDIDVDKLLIETTKDLQNQKLLEMEEEKISNEKDFNIIEKLKDLERRVSELEAIKTPEEI